MQHTRDHQIEDINFSSAITWAALALTALGLIIIYSASSLKGAFQFDDPYLFIRKQSIVAAGGFFLIFALRYIPMHWFQKASLPLFLITLVLLLLIFIPGAYVKVGGAYRWLNLGPFRFQPSEITKLAIVFLLAKNLSRASSNVQQINFNLLSNFAIFLILGCLLMLQRDFGTTVLLAGVTFFMLYIAGLPRKLIVSTFAIGIALFTSLIITVPYRVKRLLSFLDPWSDVADGGFQIIQSYLGFQNGGAFGVGLGESKQKLFFLPEAHTDFILAVIGEELGLVGVLVVCFLYLFLVWVGFQISNRQDTIFKQFLAYGLTCIIGLQAVFNMGVVMGLLPTKGIPLPFISSGASSLIVSLIIVGILARLDQEVRIIHESKQSI